MSEQLIKLLESSSDEVLAAAKTESPVVTQLRLTQLEYTLRQARQLLPDLTSTGKDKLQADPTALALKRLEVVESKFVNIELQLRAAANSASSSQPESKSGTKETPKRRGRDSISLSRRELFDELLSLQSDGAASSSANTPGSQNNDKSALKQRNGKPLSNDTTLGRLANDNDEQNELAGEVLEMVQSIRKNAEEFQKKMILDKSVVDAAADSIDKAGEKMTVVQSKLGKYRATTALGWAFYIKAFLFIAVGLIVGLLLIQLFPKFKR